MADNFISNLGAILLISFLVSVVVRHRPRIYEKLAGATCLFIGCLIALIVQINNPQAANQALLTGFGATALAFLAMLFFEETTWAIKKIAKSG